MKAENFQKLTPCPHCKVEGNTLDMPQHADGYACTEQIENKQEWEDRFDKQFGKLVEDEYSSYGRSAGCDDCESNKELREEHKQFLKQEIYKAVLKERERIREKIEKLQILNTSDEYITKSAILGFCFPIK